MSAVKMAAVGDNLVDRYLEDKVMYPGGSAANAAVFGRRIGIQTGYIGVRGNDREGDHIHHALVSEGVDVARVRVEQAHPTAVTDVRITSTGNREFVAYAPMRTPIVLDSDDLRYLAAYNWIHTGHTSGLESQLDSLSRVAPVGYDFSHRRLDYASELLPHVTFATYSGEDITVDEALDLAKATVRLGARYSIVTRGVEPVVVVSRLVEGVFPIEPVDAIDTLGAGDAFQVAFEKAVYEGSTLKAAAAAAASFASSVCLTPSAFGYPAAIASRSSV